MFPSQKLQYLAFSERQTVCNTPGCSTQPVLSTLCTTPGSCHSHHVRAGTDPIPNQARIAGMRCLTSNNLLPHEQLRNDQFRGCRLKSTFHCKSYFALQNQNPTAHSFQCFTHKVFKETTGSRFVDRGYTYHGSLPRYVGAAG